MKFDSIYYRQWTFHLVNFDYFDFYFFILLLSIDVAPVANEMKLKLSSHYVYQSRCTINTPNNTIDWRREFPS